MSKPIPSEFFNGKSVAVVGNAESALLLENGSKIDEADIVIRFNWAMPDQNQRESIGTRCDLMVSAISICRRSNKRGILKECRERWPNIKLACRGRTSLTDWHFMVKDKVRARRMVGAEPSTGIIVLSWLIHETYAESIDAYGFDGMKTGVWYQHQHHSKRHRPRKEQKALRELASKTGITFHA